MENNDQNNLKPPVAENTAPGLTTPPQNPATQNPTPNLDQKRDELMSSGEINDEVSSYLKELGGKDNPSPIGSSARPPEERKNLKQSIVRTYKSDAEEAIKMEKMSSVSIAIAEEKKKRQYEPIEPSADSPKSKKVLVFIISLFFVFGGIGAFNFNYIKEKINTPPTPKKELEIKSIITADSSVEINLSELDKKDIGSSLSEIINTTDLNSNSIKNIYITKNIIENGNKTKKIATPREFLPLLSSKIPDILFRSLSSEYMLGAHSQDGNQPFVILKTDSYENGFAGMLSWEKSIAGDLNAIFPRSVALSAQEGTTTTDQILSYEKDFEDVLVNNKDTRALRDENSDIFLIYSLPDKETIIIASNIYTIAELFDRIIRSRTVR